MAGFFAGLQDWCSHAPKHATQSKVKRLARTYISITDVRHGAQCGIADAEHVVSEPQSSA